MKEQAVNTFKGGLMMDVNPMSGDGTTLSNALNATLITHNGNEFMLQNDMGNGRINKVRLDEGYIPVGIKEHGGIIYIASYNPENKNGQIGSFPYPKVEWDNNEFIDKNLEENRKLSFIYGDESSTIPSTSLCNDQPIILNEIINSSQKIKLFIIEDDKGEQVQAKFKQGDYFSLTFTPETSKYLMSENVEASIVSKTASDYVTLYTISKEELSEEGTTISATYNYPYSGTLFLQISLNIPDTFDISYKYDGNNFIIYPYAYKSNDPKINTTIVDIEMNEVHKCNFDCPNITLSNGTYYLRPVTSDKGYLNYLNQKLILDDQPNHIFKYKFNDGSLNLYWDIYADDSQYQEGDSYRFTYNFYPLENASSVKSLEALQKLTPTKQIISNDYPAISGLRNLKCSIPVDTIYVLLITVSAKNQDVYGIEKPCFGGFIYGTSRYNEMFDTYDNFNTIQEDPQAVKYTFNRQLLELNRESITNKHLLYDETTQRDKWYETQGVIVLNESSIPANNIPKAYSSEIAVKITKTEEPIVVAPSQNVKFIYDSDQFSIESAKFNVNLLTDAEVHDVPELNKSTRIITSRDLNEYRPIDQDQDSITFYRYISSESSDGQIQQTRTFKQLMPIFNPNMTNYEELFGFDFTDSTVTGVFASEHYLNMTENITLSVGDNSDRVGTDNKLSGESEGNATPGVIKQFLLTHSKDYRGQDTSSIFDLFGGATKIDWELRYASLRIKDSYYIPYKRFGGLESSSVRNDEFAKHGNYIMPSCLTYTNQALLLPLPSAAVGIHYTRNYIDEESRPISSRTTYPKNEITPAHNLTSKEQDLIIPAFKKLFCLLSQIFTLQEQESYVYIVGPSEVTINYNIQDNSYVKYTSTLNNDDIFIDESIQESLDNVKDYLWDSLNLTVKPYNYIGMLKLEREQNNYFFYGRDVDMSNALYNDILSQYINAYDESVVVDNSSGYSSNDIYYLDSKKLYEKNGPMHNFSYTDAHNRIESNANYPMDQNGKLVTDENYNKLWSDYDIYYNPGYNCYQYDLSKTNFISLLTKSTLNSTNYLLDWAGNCWIIPSLINSFMTIEEAKGASGSQIASYSNNFIVLRTLNTVSSIWSEPSSDPPGPTFAKIDLGFRGNQRDYICAPINTTFLTKITEKIENIINLYNHNMAAINGWYLDQTTPTTPYTP